MDRNRILVNFFIHVQCLAELLSIFSFAQWDSNDIFSDGLFCEASLTICKVHPPSFWSEWPLVTLQYHTSVLNIYNFSFVHNSLFVGLFSNVKMLVYCWNRIHSSEMKDFIETSCHLNLENLVLVRFDSPWDFLRQIKLLKEEKKGKTLDLWSFFCVHYSCSVSDDWYLHVMGILFWWYYSPQVVFLVMMLSLL